MLIGDSEFAFLPKVTLSDLHAMLTDDSEFVFLPKVTLTDHHAMLIVACGMMFCCFMEDPAVKQHVTASPFISFILVCALAFCV